MPFRRSFMIWPFCCKIQSVASFWYDLKFILFLFEKCQITLCPSGLGSLPPSGGRALCHSFMSCITGDLVSWRTGCLARPSGLLLHNGVPTCSKVGTRVNSILSYLWDVENGCQGRPGFSTSMLLNRLTLPLIPLSDSPYVARFVSYPICTAMTITYATYFNVK
jgi:hypothetical protein